MQTEAAAYQRIVLKLSGEALQVPGARENISPQIVLAIAERIKEVRDLDVQVGVVIGGGNIWRGTSAAHRGMDRTTADYMGMLATVINGLALQSACAQIGVETRVQTAIEMKNVAEPFIRGRAIRRQHAIAVEQDDAMHLLAFDEALGHRAAGSVDRRDAVFTAEIEPARLRIDRAIVPEGVARRIAADNSIGPGLRRALGRYFRSQGQPAQQTKKYRLESHGNTPNRSGRSRRYQRAIWVPLEK